MDTDSKIYKLAREGKVIPQIAEKLNQRIKDVRNVIDKNVREGNILNP